MAKPTKSKDGIGGGPKFVKPKRTKNPPSKKGNAKRKRSGR